ncbi:MAG: sugar-binding protein, partial [Candidatus Omnitrophota bacterium]
TFVMNAGSQWTYEIKDDFTGWKEFKVYREEMKTADTKPKWDATGLFSLRFQPVGSSAVDIADIHLLTARGMDFADKEKPAKRSVTIYKTSTPPVIDGLGNDACWKDAEVVTDFFKVGTQTLSASKTQAKLCYDDENLYILFNNIEPIVSLSAVKLSETEVFQSDHDHMHIDPYRDKKNFFEIAVDTSGTMADMKFSAGGMDLKWNGEYEVKTSLNYNASWLAELRIPFKTLGKAAKDGDTWGITFARIDITREFSSWTTGEWADPSGFGDMTFGGYKP